MLIGFNLCVIAQEETQNSSSVKYDLGALEKMDKLELTKIYVAKINKLYIISAYTPFGKIDPKSPNDLKIPSTSINEKSMSTLEKSAKEYTETIEASLSNLIPYADKKYIMESILFLQTVIDKIEFISLGVSEIH